jgi:hypothetical protein
MPWRARWGSSGWTILAALVTVAVVAGVAYAAADGGGSARAYSACVSRSNGVLYLAHPCEPGDRRVALGAKGTAGRRGKPGTAGPAGAVGQTGPKGDTGAQGNPGAPGSAGATGHTGATGATGATGPTGADTGTGLLARIKTASSCANLPNNGCSDFGSPSGTSNSSNTESDVTMVSPNTTLTARDLTVTLTTAVSNNSNRSFTLRVAGVDTALTCTIGSFGSTCSTAAATTVVVPAGSLISIHDNAPAAFSTLMGDALVSLRLTTG